MSNAIKKNKKSREEKIFTRVTKTRDFPIVGIGASAGGLEALESFFGAMPNDPGMAFVVIQHLDPNYVGMMPEILQRRTKMKVLEATDGLAIETNHVYVIPPKKTMSILNAVLFLFEPIESHGLRLPIDYFFNSLANDRLENSIGIILSGMGSDGSLGSKAIKAKNGILLVQEPADAKYDSMPQSVLNQCVADIIAPAIELPAKLIAFLNPSALAPVLSTQNIDNLSSIDKIIILLRTHNKHDFSMYKKNTLFRRIERRMSVHLIEGIDNYVRFLTENPTELDILFKELLIGVTSFFRDPLVWEMFINTILPDLFKIRPNGHVFRAWIPACSTGEEAYSLAIAFKEALEKEKDRKNFSLQVFGTDIDNDAIANARKAVFNSNIASDISPERLSNFFTKTSGGFQVKSNIREMVVFAPQNVIRDPPFTRLDIVACRNMLIYMEPVLQKKIMALFHYSLNVDGIMLLGSAESNNTNDLYFSVIDSKLKFYKRSETSAIAELVDFPSAYTYKKAELVAELKTENSTPNIQLLANEYIQQNYSPASLLINADGDILFISGKTGKYLEPAAGKANLNIFAMAREGLGTPLIGAIRRAKQNYEPQILHGVKVGPPDTSKYVDITVQHIEKPEAMRGKLMVVFSESHFSVKSERKPITSKNATANLREEELEHELLMANEDLQCAREEMQATQEELKSTNEELQSSNEEMQSTNEELTTSKEEMQSLNEELQTMNTEMQNKLTEFVQANNDMKNLLNSTDIATLFLDRDLNIRRYTDQITKIIRLRPTDIGRPFTDLISTLRYPEIEKDARKVLQTLIFIETYIATIDERWFAVKIMPYRTVEDRIDGLVLTFIDISSSKNMEGKLLIANNELLLQNKAKLQRANELAIANKELAFQNKEKQKRANELIIANKELAFQNKEKQKRANELAMANKELAVQNKEKQKRALELSVAYKKLTVQNNEKAARESALVIANKELALQNKEKQKRADELIIAYKELALQYKEKQKRADELIIANKKLLIDQKAKKKIEAELEKTKNALKKFKV